MLCHQQPVSETPFEWRFDVGPMMTHLKWYLDPLSPHQPSNIKKKKKRNDIKFGPPLTKLSGSAHDDVRVVSLSIKSHELIQ